MAEREEGHVPCPRPDCNSSDGGKVYEDGSIWCFSCERRSDSNGNPWDYRMNKPTTVADLLSVPRTDSITKVSSLISNHPLEKLRGISEKTFRLFDYCAGTFKGQDAQIANYRDDNGLTTAQHIRYGDKQFAWLGRDKKIKIQLFGQHLGTEGVLIICEGEIDAMSVHEVLHRNRAKQRFVCCSIPDGASSAVKSVKAQLKWVLGFKKVVVFDTDGPGREAASKLPEVMGQPSTWLQASPTRMPTRRCRLAMKQPSWPRSTTHPRSGQTRSFMRLICSIKCSILLIEWDCRSLGVAGTG